MKKIFMSFRPTPTSRRERGGISHHKRDPSHVKISDEILQGERLRLHWKFLSRNFHVLGMTLGVIFTFAYLFFNFSTASAQSVRYPIQELGNCRNANECYLYCQIPQNSPACWSYGKYVMNTQEDVLGETTVNIIYPIPELGNCADANACFIYCNQPKNQSACYMYAKNNGLIKDDENTTNDMSEEKMQEIISAAQTELGCSSKDSCMTLCNNPDNFEKCRSFAIKHNLSRPGDDDNLRQPPSTEVVGNAKTELGCDGPQSCSSFCNRPENGEKCFEFAKKHNLIREEETKHRQDYMEKKKEMLEEAKTELGCDTYESCAKFCGDPNNVEKCMNLGRRHGMAPPPPNQQLPPPKPCTTEAECRAYCGKNPQECKGYNNERKSFTEMPPISPMARISPISQNKQLVKPGEFLGPGGCKSEGECKSYCEKHPNDCPGFPKEKVTPQAQRYNTQSSSEGKPPPNPSSPQTNFRPPLPLGDNSGGSNSKPPEYKPPENKYEDINKSGNSGKYESEHD